MSERWKPGVSVVLIAHNEADRIREWLGHVTWADEVIVVDSGSTDNTAEIASELVDRVISVTNKLNFDINKALGFAQASHEWILSLDADEYPTDALISEIQKVARDSPCEIAGYVIPFRTFILGQEFPIKDRHIRLFRVGRAVFPENTVHQEIRVDGQIGHLEGEILHYADRSLFDRVRKVNLYSECMAAYWYAGGKPYRWQDMLIQPLFHFLRMYVIQGGFRCGTLGLIHSVNGSYSVFLRYAKLWSAYKFGSFASPSDERSYD